MNPYINILALMTEIRDRYFMNDADDPEDDDMHETEDFYTDANGVRCHWQTLKSRKEARIERLEFVLIHHGFFYQGKAHRDPRYELQVFLGKDFVSSLVFPGSVFTVFSDATNYIRKYYRKDVTAFDVQNRNSVLGFIKWYFYYSQYTEFTEVKS